MTGRVGLLAIATAFRMTEAALVNQGLWSTSKIVDTSEAESHLGNALGNALDLHTRLDVKMAAACQCEIRVVTAVDDRRRT